MAIRELEFEDRTDEYLKELGARLHMLRYRKRMTLEAVEAATGISAGSQSKWERGLVEPGVLSVLKLCSFYEVLPNVVLADLGGTRVNHHGQSPILKLLNGIGRGQKPIQHPILDVVSSANRM